MVSFLEKWFTLPFLVTLLEVILVAGEMQLNTTPVTPRNPVLVLLLDGFKWDYLDLIPDSLGGFSEFVKQGVRAEHVNGIYPTNSYPSWTTLSTGLYAESHGILGNYFYNREENARFELDKPNTQPFWWQTAEPIWTTATKHGLKVGTILWSRSDVPFNGILPESYQGFQEAKNWTAIEDTLNKSLHFFQDGYNLVMAYGEHIDNIGHKCGPKSSELKQALIDVGAVLERFFINLKKAGLRDKVNILLVSDHGMTDGSLNAPTRFYEIESFIDLSKIEYLMEQGSLLQVYTKPGHVDSVYEDLQKMEGVKIYQKKNIPQSYHYGNNVNAPDILVVAEKGNLVIGAGSSLQIPMAMNSSAVQGVHGYDPAVVTDMRTVFMATGPDFKRGVMKPAIDLVDIYQMYCYLLSVKPKPNNGTWSKVKDFFASDFSNSAVPAAMCTSYTELIVTLCLATLLLCKI